MSLNVHNQFMALLVVLTVEYSTVTMSIVLFGRLQEQRPYIAL